MHKAHGECVPCMLPKSCLDNPSGLPCRAAALLLHVLNQVAGVYVTERFSGTDKGLALVFTFHHRSPAFLAMYLKSSVLWPDRQQQSELLTYCKEATMY